MRIRILSDLHLTDQYPLTLPPVEADVTVLAGDLVTMGTDPGVPERLKRLYGSIQSNHILVVPGNHEWYGHQWDDPEAVTKVLAQDDRVRVLHCDSCHIDGVDFFGATLWTTFSWSDFDVTKIYNGRKRVNQAFFGKAAEKLVNDFRLIKGLTWGKMVLMGLAHQLALERMLENGDRRNRRVVITHFPAFPKVAPQYQGSVLNAYFVNDIRVKSRVDLWVSGHTHSSMRYQIDHVKPGFPVYINPHGYGDENPLFDPNLVVDLEVPYVEGK